MTIGREQSDFSQGDLVFRGRLRVPISGRTHHLRHLQERTKLQQRLDVEGKNSTSTYLREELTQLYAFYDPVGPADGTEGYRHPRKNPPTKSDCVDQHRYKGRVKSRFYRYSDVLTAIAWDAAGNHGVSVEFKITIDNPVG